MKIFNQVKNDQFGGNLIKIKLNKRSLTIFETFSNADIPMDSERSTQERISKYIIKFSHTPSLNCYDNAYESIRAHLRLRTYLMIFYRIIFNRVNRTQSWIQLRQN